MTLINLNVDKSARASWSWHANCGGFGVESFCYLF